MIGLTSDNKRDSHSPFVHEEKLRFKLFPDIDSSAVGIRDLPFAISETRNKYVEGNYWTAISDGSHGMAYFNKGNMGSIRENDNSFSIPLAYSMYYIWGTRMLYGPFEYEFAVFPFQGSWKTADIQKKALEYNLQIPVYESIPGNGKLRNMITNISISGDKNILLTALYPENGNVIARFFKPDEINQGSTLQLNCEGRDITETRMDGTKIKEVNGTITVKPWEIKTFRIKQD
jgi:alpha-mannosidase